MSTMPLSNLLPSRFGSTSKEVKEKLLDDVNAKNTNRATKATVAVLEAYIKETGQQNLPNTPDADIPDLLEKFYVAAKTKKGETYNTQSLKGPPWNRYTTRPSLQECKQYL